MKRLEWLALVALLGVLAPFSAKGASPDYSIQAIRYSSVEYNVAGMVMGAPSEKITIAMVVWLIRGGGRNILFDSGFHHDTFLKSFPSTDYIPPDEAVKLAGVQPEEITDIVISHAHWDHMCGIDLFPKAAVWIQKEEFRYYVRDAWQPGGHHGGIDPEDVRQLVKLNTEGRLHFVDGDDVEIFPGFAPTQERVILMLPNTCASREVLRSSWPPTIAISIAILRNTKPAPLSLRPIAPPTSRTRSG